MTRWGEIENKLKAMTLRSRKQLFKEFKSVHVNWHQPTFDALGEVVVHLRRQVDVCEEYKIPKQLLNRSVRHYRYYVLRQKIVH